MSVDDLSSNEGVARGGGGLHNQDDDDVTESTDNIGRMGSNAEQPVAIKSNEGDDEEAIKGDVLIPGGSGE